MNILNLLCCGVTVFAFGCGGFSERALPESDSDNAHAVERIARGDLIREIEEAQNEQANQYLTSPAAVKTLAVEQTDSSPANEKSEPLSKGKVKYPDVPTLGLEDPCGNVPKQVMSSDQSKIEAAIGQLGACQRNLVKAHTVYESLLLYFIRFKIKDPAIALSQLTLAEAEDFLASHDFILDIYVLIPPAKQKLLRSSFSDEELLELVAINAARRAAMDAVEKFIYAAMDARKPLLEAAAQISNRYRAMLVMRKTYGDQTGNETAAALIEALEDSVPVPEDTGNFPVSLMHPYGLLSLIPDEGSELKPLDDLESPFYRMIYERNLLNGESSWMAAVIAQYASARDQDNPALPAAPSIQPANGAVGVAFLDTAIDFVRFKDLGRFLSMGDPRRVRSWDYADGDANPWGAYGSPAKHGTMTSATLLTVLSRYAPEVLREQKLDLAMWKINTVRELLSGPPYTGSQLWENRLLPVLDATIDQIENPEMVKPKIVSVSLGFRTEAHLQRAKRPNLLMHAPWLWVMSAGNDGLDVNDVKSECFADVPEERRGRDRILCVGALKRGILKESDRIAYYSNLGDLVDVYAYETFVDLCPAGTSCSTPAVSAAAAVLAAKFHRLTSQQIKQAIVEASEERELAVETPEDGRMDPSETLAAPPSELLKVRVFDPTTEMLGRAIQVAGRLSRNK